MDPALILITVTRSLRDYQQTIDQLARRVAELEAQLAAVKEAPSDATSA